MFQISLKTTLSAASNLLMSVLVASNDRVSSVLVTGKFTCLSVFGPHTSYINQLIGFLPFEKIVKIIFNGFIREKNSLNLKILF